jgi:hypothetical protein
MTLRRFSEILMGGFLWRNGGVSLLPRFDVLLVASPDIL